MYSKLIVKRHDSGWSPLTLEWLEGSHCYSRVISSTMNKGSKEHLKPIVFSKRTDLHARACTCSTTMAAYIPEKQYYKPSNHSKVSGLHPLSCLFTISLLYTKCPPFCSHACKWLACIANSQNFNACMREFGSS